MKTTLCALAALLLLAAGTGCQTCGPLGGGGMLSSSCTNCGGAADCGCGDACGDLCGDACGGNCGTGGGVLGRLGNGRVGGGFGGGYGPVGHGGALVGGALAGLHGPTPGGSRISGNFSFHGNGGKHALGGHGAVTPAEPGPPTAAYSYPYYTTRGPRDFFMDNPPPLGR